MRLGSGINNPARAAFLAAAAAVLISAGAAAQSDGAAPAHKKKKGKRADAEQLCDLGGNYENGVGVAKDPAQAVAWYRKSAGLGSARCQNVLGNSYFNGFGVDKNLAEAIKWYKAAAAQGDASAELNLGVVYYNGWGTPKDDVEAVGWFRKAADHGNAAAQFYLGASYQYGYGVPADKAEALKWYQKSAQQGDANGETCLGNVYHEGVWVKKDETEALRWYRGAAEQGNQSALASLRTIAMADQGGEEARAILKELERRPPGANRSSGRLAPAEIERRRAAVEKNPLFQQVMALEERYRQTNRKDDYRAVLEKSQDCVRAAGMDGDSALATGCRLSAARVNIFEDYNQAELPLIWARSYYETIGDSTGTALVLVSFGDLAGKRVNTKLQISYYLQALELEKGLSLSGGNLYRQLAAAYAYLGRFQDAAAFAERGVQASRAAKDDYQVAGNLIAKGNVLIQIGDDAGALAAFSDAADILRRLGRGPALGLALSQIANVRWIQGDLAEAIAVQKQAIAASASRGGGFQNYRLAKFEIWSGDAAAAEEEVKRGFGGKVPDWTLLSLAEKDYAKAERLSQMYVDANEKTRPNLEKLFSAYCGLGLADLGLKKYAPAREAFEKAVQLSEDQREALAPEQRAAFFEGSVDDFLRTMPYKGLVETAAAEGDAGKAFFWSENLKARMLAEAVARGQSANDSSVPAEMKEAEEALRRTIAEDKRSMAAMYLENDTAGYAARRKDLDKARQERKDLVASMRKRYPQYAAVAYPEPIEPKDAALAPNETLVEFEIGEEKSFLILVTGRGKKARVREIPVSRGRLLEATERYRSFFENVASADDLAKFDPKAGRELYALLFGDALDKLPPETSLIIVPDEFLGTLPFESLPVSVPEKESLGQGDHGPFPLGVAYLGDKFPIAYAQSAASLTVLRSLPSSGEELTDALAVGDPVFSAKDRRAGQETADGDSSRIALMGALSRWQTMGVAGTKARGAGASDSSDADALFPRLEKTRLIAQDVAGHFGGRATVLLGPDATEEAVLKLPFERYKYVVLATHGILSGDIPYIREPALVLSQVGNREGYNGFLKMSQVMGLKIPAEVVALPACQTGVGKNVGGEGVMGMGRAFQYAGAKNVMMSLYSVAEDATVALTDAFLDRLAEGAVPRDALRKAREDVRRQGYENPFYWSAFILMGR